jgi:hypothetical protein
MSYGVSRTRADTCGSTKHVPCDERLYPAVLLPTMHVSEAFAVVR